MKCVLLLVNVVCVALSALAAQCEAITKMERSASAMLRLKASFAGSTEGRQRLNGRLARRISF